MDSQEIKKEINQILKLLLEGHSRISYLLKRTNRICNAVDFKELSDFVNKELNGYDQRIPEWRKIKSKPIGVFQNRFTGLTDRQPLIYDGLAKQMKVDVNDMYTRQISMSVSELEDFEKNRKTDEILFAYTPQQLNFARQFMEEDEKNGWHLYEAYFVLPQNTFRRILEISANKLEEYLLELQSKLNTSERNTEQFFEDGKSFDAIRAITDKLRGAKKIIILIDGYVDDHTLNILSCKKPHVQIKMLTNKKSNTSSFKAFVRAFNIQHQNLEVRNSNAFHDRFLIIDNDYYHIGASIKDAGKNSFMISLIQENFIKEGITKKFNEEWENYSSQ